MAARLHGSGLEDDVDQFIIPRFKHKFNKLLLVNQHHLGILHRFQSPAINMCSPDHPQGLRGLLSAPPPPLRPVPASPLRPDMKAWTYLHRHQERRLDQRVLPCHMPW